MINKQNPYENLSDNWLKGSLHTHSSPASPCGKQPLSVMLDLYEKAGYDFLSLSDHLVHTETEGKSTMIMIPGLEWNSRTEEEALDQLTYFNHVGLYSLDRALLTESIQYKTQDELFSFLKDKPDVLTILNHPDWQDPTEHYPYEALKEKRPHCTGMEIYNAVIDGLEGQADSTEKWDRILSESGYFPGFVSDDSHDIGDVHKAWLMVNADFRTAESILKALEGGRFYGSTGVSIQEIGRRENNIFCRAEGDVFVEAIGEGGRTFAAGQESLRVNLPESGSSYIRFVLRDSEDRQAWSQPFFA
ncbi:MAG: hypothetical protein PQJ60_03140 [Spirochaetales bacterium]|nr:hypothetical protein [Spirochaetales bacterium]